MKRRDFVSLRNGNNLPLGLRKEEIVFAAFGGWDAVGAKWFGYPTFWVNRAHVARKSLGQFRMEQVET